jgi:hypothetical protein
MSWNNEIANELYRVKDEYAAKFDYDLDRMVIDLQQKEKSEKRKGRRFVGFAPRRCQPEFPFAPVEAVSQLPSPPLNSGSPQTGDAPPVSSN